jgi:hypothetical protein
LLGGKHLKLVNLILAVAELFEHTLQLALILRTLLHPGDRLVHSRWSTHKHLDILLLRSWNGLFEQFLRDVSLPIRPALGWCVDGVERAESLRVFILQLLELFLQEDVFFGQVGKDQGYLGLVGWVLEDPTGQLEHGCDARPASDQSDVVVLVCRPRVFGNWTFEVEALAGCHAVHVLGHGAVGIAFDHQIEVASFICTDRSAVMQGMGDWLTFVTDGCVWSDHRLLHIWRLDLCDKRG